MNDNPEVSNDQLRSFVKAKDNNISAEIAASMARELLKSRGELFILRHVFEEMIAFNKKLAGLDNCKSALSLRVKYPCESEDFRSIDQILKDLNEENK
jgi:hypothetical protein